MKTTILLMILMIFAAGMVGGVANALVSENGFMLPKSEEVEGGSKIFRPGWFGNMLIGGVGATISWGLYGPLSSYILLTTAAKTAATELDGAGLSLAALVGAMLVGATGARWLTNEVDKSLLKAAASKAAGSVPSTKASQQIAVASPARALEIAKQMIPQT